MIWSVYVVQKHKFESTIKVMYDYVNTTFTQWSVQYEKMLF